MDIFVTGIGTLNSIGLSAQESLDALKLDRSGMQWSAENNMMLGSINLSNAEIKSQLNGDLSDYSRTALLGIMAAKEAWGGNKNLTSVRTGLISSTSVGELQISESIYKEANEIGSIDYDLLTQEAGRTTEQIADYLGITGYVNTISTACSSGANAILLGARLIQSGRFDRMLVGGIDPFCSHNLKGFSSLNICDKNSCQPFDKDRKGLNLAEGSAFLVLENKISIAHTSNKILSRLSGWANTADAFHQTGTSPNGRGAVLAMNQALNCADLLPSYIDYINAHGTGTANNDLSESRAIEQVFEGETPLFSSTKSFTGHTLAAAGAVEAVFCILAINNDFIPANLGFKSKMEEMNIEPVRDPLKKSLNHVLSNSFGFGGNCSTLIFSRN